MTSRPQPRPAVQQMAPYNPPTGGREGKLRLDFNENTVGCSPAVSTFLRKRLTSETLATYPEYSAARAALAKHFGVDESELTLTNGTDEAVQLIINTYVSEGDEVIVPHPSYAMYRFYAELAGARLRLIPFRKETLEFPAQEILGAVNDRTKAIFLANPNNPTGSAVSVETIEKIARRAANAAVLIDEAYYEFNRVTAMPLLASLPSLFVCRTFSKAYGMAALRLGCLFSQPENLELVRKVQSPYSVNSMAVLAAEAAIRDQGYVERYVAEILAARDLFCAGLTKLKIETFNTAGNFVLLRLGARASSVQEALRARGILVRDRSYELEGCVRVTVGT
jgi:histidinol-phosphate aminotransferase